MTLNRSREANDSLDYVVEVVENEFKNVVDGVAMTTKVCDRFRDTFNCPPVQEFEFLFHKNFTDDEVIVALFQPREEQMAYFPLILEAAMVPSPIVLTNLRSLVLSLIFLVHRKRWVFMEQFILHGGLLVLSDMIKEPNLYIRGQAIEIMLSIIDCETYDWFKPPQHDDFTQAALHKQLLGLVNNSQFLQNLLSNRVGSYPGGSCRALQILAFWWSWLRAVHTKDQKLHLSAKVLSELKLWSTVAPSAESDAALEEEMKLAAAVYEDFGFRQYGLEVDQVSAAGTNSSSSEDNNLFLGGLTNLPTDLIKSSRITEVTDIDNTNTAVKESKVSNIEICTALKTSGNTLFKDGKLTEAIEKYQEALTILKSIPEGNNAIQIDLLTNCATCYWKMYHQSTDKASTTSCELLHKCEVECNAVLSLSPHYPKAVYRLVTVMLEENRPQEALPLLLKALAYHREFKTSGKSSSGGNQEDIDDSTANNSESSVELLSNLRVRCIAAMLMKNSDQIGSLTHEELGMTPKGVQLLQSILQRNQSDAAVNWQILQSSVVDTSSDVSTSVDEIAVGTSSVGIEDKTIDTGKWILEDLLHKNKQAADLNNGMNKENKKIHLPLPSSSTIDKTSKFSKDKIKKTTDTKKKTKSNNSSVEVTNKTLVAFNNFKKLARELEGKCCTPSCSTSVETKVIEVVACVNTIWSEGFQLCDVLSVCLEESHVLTLIHVANFKTSGSDNEWSGKLVSQLCQCDRFDVVMSLSLVGNSPLKTYLVELGTKLVNSSVDVSSFIEKYCTCV